MPSSNKYSKNKDSVLSPLQRIFRFILLIMFSIFLGTGIYFINARNVLHDPYPTIGGYSASVVISGSMEPVININDLIITKQQENYNLDDVIAYIDSNGKTPVVHRIISINDDCIITKGDANNIEDKPISFNQIRGKMIVVIPGLGSLFNFTTYFILGTCIIALLIVSLIIEWNSWKEGKKRQDELRREIDKLLQLRQRQEIFK